MQSLFDYLRFSNASEADRAQISPADKLLPHTQERWVRCIDIAATPDLVYRWISQLTIAPYSFDFIDMPGRKSPNKLIPGADELYIGQKFLIFTVKGFVKNQYLAGISRSEFRVAYGKISVSYTVIALEAGGTRLRANACIAEGLGLFRRILLAAGDKIMAGKQLRRLRRLAEATAKSGKQQIFPD